MSVIIRLQNLPWSANALDIRQYFHGLSIPEGGVHIVGGEQGDAFIAFSTDEDARQAFMRNNGKIKEVQISLMLSSRTEMQKVIEAARNQSMAAFMGTVPQPPVIAPIMPSIVPASVPESKKDEKRDKRRSRSRSKDRKDRYDRKRDRRRERGSRSKSRDRTNRDRRRRDRSRSKDGSRSKDRKANREVRRGNEKAIYTPKEPRVGVWETPPQNQNLLAAQTNSADLIANFVANNILPTILNRNPQPDNNPQAQINRDAFQSRWDRGNGDNNGFFHKLPQNNFQGEQMNFQNMGDNNDIFQRDKRKNLKEKNEQQPNCCVKLHPFYGAFGEIRRFFNGLFIHNNGIKIINDEYGKRTGIIYIKFAYPEGKDEALGRTGDKIRNQLICVEHIDDEEFENAIDRYIPNDGDFDGFRNRPFGNYLVIDNLPIYVKEQDVTNIFSNFGLVSTMFQTKNHSKSALVQFNNEGEAMRAFKDPSIYVYEGNPLNVRVCSEELYEQITNDNRSDNGAKDIPPSHGATAPSNSLVISGLPKKCSDRDITDFFSDIGVVPAKVNLISNDTGFTGEAVCEFYTVDDALVGYQKNGMPFGSETVTMKYHVNKTPPPPAPPIQQNPRMPMLPPQMNNPNLNMPPIGMNRPPFFGPRNNFMGPRGPPRGPPMMNMGPRGPPMRRFHPPPPHQQNCDDQEEELAPPGCVLLMENVPYKAGLDEILEFLDGFDVPGDNVLRKYNPNGLPSGETKVIFNSPQEVYQVIEDKKGCRIRDRPIYMTQI